MEAPRTTTWDIEFTGRLGRRQRVASEEPQGQFCVLDVVVRNHDDRPGTLFAENLYLLDADGAEHSADWGATLAADPDGRTLSEEINPGNRVRGDVVFDVPEGGELTQARLHDSAFSGGVLVDLR